MTVAHSGILVSSFWRVFLIILSSHTDMPSLTTVILSKEYAFSKKKSVHTRSPSPSSLSFLDITYALQRYLSFPLSFTSNSQQLLFLSPYMPSKQLTEPTHHPSTHLITQQTTPHLKNTPLIHATCRASHPGKPF